LPVTEGKAVYASTLFPDHQDINGVPLIDVKLVNDLTQRTYNVIVTFTNQGVINMFTLSGKLGGKRAIKIIRSIVIDLAEWQKNHADILTMYSGTIFHDFLQSNLARKRRAGFVNDSCFINADAIRLLRCKGEAKVLGFDRINTILLASGFPLSERTEVSGESFPSWYAENGLMFDSSATEEQIKPNAVVRMSKEDWLKANYPEMTELPKWRFPSVTG
jgi:hypothetical protein